MSDNIETKISALFTAAYPFIQLVAIADELPPNFKEDSCPLAKHVPGVWPTLGALRNLVAAIQAMKPDDAPVSRSLVELAERMESEAGQFHECTRRHQRHGNTGAAAVADRARLRLLQFASELRQEKA